MASTPPEPITLRMQQQRLLLLRHATYCQHERGKCPVTPHCAGMKRLWNHIIECKDPQCQVPHCKSSRDVLTHYHNCKDPRCEICSLVREANRKQQEKQLAVPCHVTATTTPPPPPPASKAVDDLRARRINVAAAVCEAALRAVPPDSDPQEDKRFQSAIGKLHAAVITDAHDFRQLNEYLALSRHDTSRRSTMDVVKILKRWPRLRKYFPRIRRRICSYCGKGRIEGVNTRVKAHLATKLLAEPRLMVCGGCGQGSGVGRYCSEDCQRAHWPEHQKHCPRLDL